MFDAILQKYSRLISFYFYFFIIFNLAQCCKRPGNFPLEEEGPCHHYISCTRDSLGFISREIKECPEPGQIFQASSNSCVYGNCHLGNTEAGNPPEHEDSKSITPDFNLNAVTQALSTFFPSLAKQPSISGRENPSQRHNNRRDPNKNVKNYDPQIKYINPDSSCPSTGAYAIPGDCQRFYWCGAFITTLFKCPRNHQFKYGKCRQTGSYCSSRYFGLPIPFYLRHRLVAGDDEDEYLPSSSVSISVEPNEALPSEETTLISFPDQDYKTPPRVDAINPYPDTGNSKSVVDEPMALPSNFLPLAATTTEIYQESSSTSKASTSYFRSQYLNLQYQNESHFYISIFQLLLVHLFAQILF